MPNSKITLHFGIDGPLTSSNSKILPFILWSVFTKTSERLLIDVVDGNLTDLWTFSGKFS
ncbi:MAG: hypothetical protein PVF96_07510 [Candidatus Bathyarchaeota archaeon]|jgi:hypothetical protein